MSLTTVQQKDKKIQQLKALLGQAKNKIDELKSIINQKNNQIQQLKNEQQKKIQKLQGNQNQIMKQYEQRILRMQKSLQQSDNLVSKNQKLAQLNSKNYQKVINQLANISSLIFKNFTSIPNKQSNEAIQQLCNIQKCKDFEQKIQKNKNQVPELDQIIQSILKINSFYVNSLNSKREARLLFMKKQANLQKQLQDENCKHSSSNKQIQKLKLQLKQTQQKYEKKIQTIAKSKAKVSEEKTNIEFIKQLFIKFVLGPKQATIMAFQILSKVLKLTQNQYNTCTKKLK